MKINRKEFLNALNRVKPGLSSQETLEQSDSFVFKGGFIFSFNDEIAIRHPLPFEIGEGAVPAKELLKILSKLKEAEITIEMTDKEVLFKGKRAKAGVKRDVDIQLPIDQIEVPKKFKDLPANFIDSVGYCLNTVSTDLSIPLLNNVAVQEESVQSSDNYRVSIADLDEEMIPFLLPARSARQLLSYNPNQYAIDKVGFVHFKTEDGTIFSCRICEGDFKDQRANTKIDGTKIIFPDGLVDLLDIAGTFISGGVGDDTGLIDITIKNNWIEVSGQSDNGWAESKERMKYEGEPIQFQMSCLSLLAILGDTNQAELSGGILVFSGEGFIYLTAVIPQNNVNDHGIPF